MLLVCWNGFHGFRIEPYVALDVQNSALEGPIPSSLFLPRFENANVTLGCRGWKSVWNTYEDAAGVHARVHVKVTMHASHRMHCSKIGKSDHQI